MNALVAGRQQKNDDQHISPDETRQTDPGIPRPPSQWTMYLALDPSEVLARQDPWQCRARPEECACAARGRLACSDGLGQTPSHDPALIDLITRAHRCLASLTDGTRKNLTEIAKQHQTELSEVSRFLPLAFLSPKITQSILAGT